MRAKRSAAANTKTRGIESIPSGEGAMTNYFFHNTDAGSLIAAPRPRYRVLIAQHCAATGGPRSFGEQLGYTH